MTNGPCRENQTLSRDIEARLHCMAVTPDVHVVGDKRAPKEDAPAAHARPPQALCAKHGEPSVASAMRARRSDAAVLLNCTAAWDLICTASYRKW